MKRTIVLNAGLFLLFAMLSCKKGDTGPAGETGPQGPQGIAGNANVTQYSYGVQNLATSSFAQLMVSTTKDTMDKSAWFVYLYFQPLDRWYFIPGYGNGGSTQYRVSMGYTANKAIFYIDKIGAGETYAQAKVVRIYTSSQQAGGRYGTGTNSLPDIDFADYEAVRSYYQLPR